MDLFEETKKFYDDLEKDRVKAIKKEFKGRIKENFLLKMRTLLIDKYSKTILSYFDDTPDVSFLLKGTLNDHIDLEVCRNIVGIHRHNTLYMDDKARADLQESAEYKEKLAEQVLTHLKLRHYAGMYARVHRITIGEEYLFYSPMYKIFVLCTRALDILRTNPQRKETYFYSLIFEKCLSALMLLEGNMFSSIYPICRVIIEIYVRLLVVNINPKALDSYFQFVDLQLQRGYGTEYPESFVELYNNRKYKTKDKKNDYLNFGWIDKIDDFDSHVKYPHYNFYALIDYLLDIYSDEINYAHNLNTLTKHYRNCHSYTHGIKGNSLYSLNDYENILIMLSYTIPYAYLMLCYMYNVDPKIEGLDIAQMTLSESIDFLKRRDEYLEKTYK
jgi:hypothetical protein